MLIATAARSFNPIQAALVDANHRGVNLFAAANAEGFTFAFRNMN
jgi:hypothetical protein